MTTNELIRLLNDCTHIRHIEFCIKLFLKGKRTCPHGKEVDWFTERGLMGDDDEVCTDSIFADVVEFFDEELNGHVIYSVNIYASCVDQGSDDYVYSYSID